MIRNGKGFTLLELTISITLIGMVVMILVGAMRLSSRSVESGERKIGSFERVRSSFNIIDSQIQSYIPLKYEEDGNTKSYFKGEREFIQLATNYSIWGGQRGYVIAAYRVESDNSGKQFISVSENVIGAAQNRTTSLFTAYDRIYFEYFYKEATEEQGQWYDRAPDDPLETIVPEKVRLSLIDGHKTLALIIPLRATSDDSTSPSSYRGTVAPRGFDEITKGREEKNE
ncbi:MAG: type II secretion system protein [Nitrospira sp.]|nr:type II secretion system protein [Nitrospira sp.]